MSFAPDQSVNRSSSQRGGNCGMLYNCTAVLAQTRPRGGSLRRLLSVLPGLVFPDEDRRVSYTYVVRYRSQTRSEQFSKGPLWPPPAVTLLESGYSYFLSGRPRVSDEER